MFISDMNKEKIPLINCDCGRKFFIIAVNKNEPKLNRMDA